MDVPTSIGADPIPVVELGCKAMGPATQTEQVYNTGDKRPTRYLDGEDDIYYDNDKANTQQSL